MFQQKCAKKFWYKTGQREYNLLDYKVHLFILRERERERERKNEQREGQRERGKERILSRLQAVRAESGVGLDPTNRKIMT